MDKGDTAELAWGSERDQGMPANRHEGTFTTMEVFTIQTVVMAAHLKKFNKIIELYTFMSEI